jgi:hypothetical protein
MRALSRFCAIPGRDIFIMNSTYHGSLSYIVGRLDTPMHLHYLGHLFQGKELGYNEIQLSYLEHNYT